MDQGSLRLRFYSGEQTLEVGEFKKKSKSCDRCGIIDATVSLFDECLECGEIDLCQDCKELHLEEIKRYESEFN